MPRSKDSLKNIIPPKQPAANPKQAPRFSVTLKNSKGRALKLSDPRAIRALIACMDMEAGLHSTASHWGGPSALAEILSALYALVFDRARQKGKEWFELFFMINDAGHCENALYALKANYGMAGLSLQDLRGFRSLKSHLTGHGEAHLFPEGVHLSNGPLGSTIAQAQGLSMADKLLLRERMTISILSDGACMEGEAKEALSAIPGLAGKGLLNPFLLIISDNNTKLSGRIDSDSYSLKPFLKSLSVCGWRSQFLTQGNQLEAVLHALEEGIDRAFEEPTKPLALIFQTQKGFGVKKTAEDPAGGHGWPLKSPEGLKDFIQEIYGSKKPPQEIHDWQKDILNRFQSQKQTADKPKKPYPSILKKVQVGVSKALIDLKKQGIPLVSISADLQGSTGVGEFRKCFPEHSFDMGVSESNMISAAVGFSKQGFVPIVDTFAQFAVTKGGLPLIMSALSQAAVIGLFSHAGFQDAGDGASHQALSYFAKTCSLPMTEVYALSCADEAHSLVSQAIETFYEEKKSDLVPKSRLFFYGRETFPESFNASSYHLKKAQVLLDYSEGPKPVLIVSCGPLVQEALKAGELLQKKHNRGVVVLNSPCVSHPDTKTIAYWLNRCEDRLLTLEDHQVKGGMSSILLLSLKEENISISKFKALGLRGGFGRSAYSALELYKLFGLDAQSVVKTVLKVF